MGAAGIVVVGVLLTYYVPSLTPWVPTGRLVIAVRAVPAESSDLLGLGIDTMVLSGENGSAQVSMRTRRALFDPKSDVVTTLLDTEARIGTYGGFSFELTSPELRNRWQEDVAPKAVSLAHAPVALPAPYTILENETTVIILSFETLQAMHYREDGATYLPVIQVETRQGGSAITNEETGVVQIEGGSISSSATYGMDWDGRIRHNFRASEPITTSEPVVPEPTPSPVSEEETASTTTNTTATTTATEGSTTPPSLIAR